jgi:hypothetical protein
MPVNVESADLTVELGKWKDGIVNTVPGKIIPGSALLDAVNVDIDDAGSVRRRSGFTKEISGGICGSLYSKAGRMFFVDDGSLKEVVNNAGTYTTDVLETGLQIGEKVSFAYANGSYYWSGTTMNGRITDAGNRDFGVEVPGSNPVLTAGSGTLFPGEYKVALCFVSSRGEQSAAKYAESVVVGDNGSISLSGIAQPISAEITHIRVFVSEANSIQLYKAVDLPVGTTSYVINKSTTKGMELKTEGLAKFHPCPILSYWRGRILGADGNVLWFSEPMALGIVDVRKNFLVFPEDISVVVSVEDGFYVCSDRTYFVSGGSPDEWSQAVVFPYGAVKHSSFENEKEKQVGWMSRFGMVVAGNGGQAKNISVDRVALDYTDASGASMLFRENGIERIVLMLPRLWS